jgi:hypothetical protein
MSGSDRGDDYVRSRTPTDADLLHVGEAGVSSCPRSLRALTAPCARALSL